jgi:two-component system cell cycle sensor histidine kinase PleC
MISGPQGSEKYSSSMHEYASLLGDAVLRHRARTAEHSARVEAGLGLPIARALVQLHGGELKVENDLNVGTRVVVTLPPCDRLSVAEVRDAVMGQGLAS